MWAIVGGFEVCRERLTGGGKIHESILQQCPSSLLLHMQLFTFSPSLFLSCLILRLLFIHRYSS